MDPIKAQDALIEHLQDAAPWNVRVSVDREASGAPFRATTGGPAYAALGAAMEEAYGRQMTSLGQGGSIPLCNVFADTFPDAEIILMGWPKHGYGSDTSRAVTVGEPTDEVRSVHDIVRRAQQTAFEAVRPGVSCQEIDRTARRVIADAGYGEQFIHRTGHGIGVTTHEPPYIVEGEEQPLVPGMCFSIEPGIYLAGRFGVRIEDIVTVTRDGGRRLNTTSHDLRVVG
ncbi:MAG TPA: M24 family metallopeptidase [Euzebyales bacterium]